MKEPYRSTDPESLADFPDRKDAWLIYFDDREVVPEIFMGAGAREAALARHEVVSQSWTTQLFVSAEKILPRKIEYEMTATTNIKLPKGPPFDGKPVLIKLAAGWVEAWWMKGRSFETQNGPDYEGFCWVCLDDSIDQHELEDAKWWLPLPIISNDDSNDKSAKTQPGQ